MDERLALRLRMFREGGQVRPAVADFVAAELAALDAAGHTVTENTAGLFTSHLMLALTRSLDGEPITESAVDPAIDAELAGHPGAVRRARAVAERARTELGAALPESEVRLLGMHLAVLAQRSAP